MSEPERTRPETTPDGHHIVVDGRKWRDLMDEARAVAAELHAAGAVEVRQRGERVDSAAARGPIRLAAGPQLG